MVPLHENRRQYGRRGVVSTGDAAQRARRSRRGSSDTGGPGEAVSGPRLVSLPVVVAALAAALLLGFLIIRYSVANALLQAGPELAAAVSPGHPRVILGHALEELQLSGRITPASAAAAFGAFRRSPLSEVPLLIAGRSAMAAGEEERAERLIEAAIRRNPRSRYGLLLRLEQEVRLGKVAEAAETMAVLTRASPNVGPLLTLQLAGLARDPSTRTAAQNAMRSDPELRRRVLEQLARQGADPEVILSLAGGLDPVPAGAEPPQWQRLLIDGMVERGEVAEAHRVWLRLMRIDPAAARGGIYDRDFAGLPGSPPFNWLLETGSNGFAEPSDGGLQVQFDARADARLASQLLVLPPGDYRLSFTAEGEASGENGRLSWTVACQPGGRPIVVAEIVGVDGSEKPFRGTFTVPPSRCPGQWLRLVGEDAEFPDDQQVTIRQLRIEGGGLR
ncbi:MAG: hypothetical protein M3177_01290 [Pseudomonadota bacterium]|nr:hypothetical protein [Pseudomonadota bacterium]